MVAQMLLQRHRPSSCCSRLLTSSALVARPLSTTLRPTGVTVPLLSMQERIQVWAAARAYRSPQHGADSGWDWRNGWLLGWAVHNGRRTCMHTISPP
jgi:hypothetical protein